MAFQSNPQRGGGQDGIAYIGPETTGMLADAATTIAALPTMTLMGYASAPSEDIQENLTDRTGVGSPLPIGPAKAGRRDVSMGGSMLLSESAACLMVLRAALRRDTTWPSGARWECMPLFALATGLAGFCDTALDEQEVGRFCVMENVSITWADGQDTRLTYRARPLLVQSSTSFAAPTESALLAASGDAFNMQESYWSATAGGVSIGGWDNTINTATLDITNVVNPAGTRHPDYTNGNSNALALIPYFWQIGTQRITLSLNTAARLNQWDALSLINENANDYLQFLATDVRRASRGRDEMQSDGRASFSSTYNIRKLEVVPGP